MCLFAVHCDKNNYLGLALSSSQLVPQNSETVPADNSKQQLGTNRVIN